MAVGTARAAYEVALDYAKTREQFGRPIIDNQGVAFQLADMPSIDAARLLVWRASWMAYSGKPFTRRGLDVEAVRERDGEKVTAQAIQILGGNGYTREYPVERMHRDAAIYTIFEGTERDPAAGDLARDQRDAHPLTVRGSSPAVPAAPSVVVTLHPIAGCSVTTRSKASTRTVCGCGRVLWQVTKPGPPLPAVLRRRGCFGRLSR